MPYSSSFGRGEAVRRISSRAAESHVVAPPSRLSLLLVEFIGSSFYAGGRARGRQLDAQHKRMPIDSIFFYVILFFLPSPLSSFPRHLFFLPAFSRCSRQNKTLYLECTILSMLYLHKIREYLPTGRKKRFPHSIIRKDSSDQRQLSSPIRS